MAVWKTVAAVYLLSFIFGQIIFSILTHYYSGYDSVHLHRLHYVFNFEFYLLIASVFLWKRVLSLCMPYVDKSDSVASKLPQYHTGNSKESRRLSASRRDGGSETSLVNKLSPLRKLVIRVVGLSSAFFLLFVHLSFVFFYYPLLSVNGTANMFVMFTFICAGFYFNAVAMLLGFSIINFVCRMLVTRLPICQQLFAPLRNIRLINAVLFNTRFQGFLALAIGAVFSLLCLYGGFQRPLIDEVRIKIKDLPASLENFKIALITDVHIGPSVGRGSLETAVSIINELNSIDLVAVGGDLVDGSVADLKTAIEPIKRFKSTYGTYFVTGNHEYYYGNVDELLEYLTDSGVHVLRNNHTKIQKGASKQEALLCFAGVDDVIAESTGLESHGMNVREALKDCPRQYPAILLAHNPRAARYALDLDPPLKRLDVILSGHTHAGQMYIFVPWMWMRAPFFEGLYSGEKFSVPTFDGETSVFVGPGLNYYAAPMKMVNYRTIPIIVLERA